MQDIDIAFLVVALAFGAVLLSLFEDYVVRY